MKCTFPYMGTTIVYKKLFELLGHETVMPPKPTQQTMDLGVKFSPEFACFPYKVIMGSYIQAAELGADTIITSGGDGPCRAGYYGEIHKKTLENIGYKDIDVMVFDSIKRDPKGFYRKAMKAKGKSSWFKVLKSAMVVVSMSRVLDKLEKQIETKRAYEVHRGECTKVWDSIQNIFDKELNSLKDLDMIEQKCQAMIDSIKTIEVAEDQKIRIGIVGEIYIVMESSMNMRVEEVLGNLGAEVRRSQYLSEWIEYNVVPKFMSKSREEEILRKGEKYIEVQIGGHAKLSVGCVVDFKDQGFDGIVHLMPFGCLPELVSQSIMPSISRELDIPILTIAMDEQTGLANNLTRIEAFLDLIKNKKQKQSA